VESRKLNEPYTPSRRNNMAKRKVAAKKSEETNPDVVEKRLHSQSTRPSKSASKARKEKATKRNRTFDDDTLNAGDRVYVTIQNMQRTGQNDEYKYSGSVLSGAGFLNPVPELDYFLFYAFLRKSDGKIVSEVSQGSGLEIIESTGGKQGTINLDFPIPDSPGETINVEELELVVAYITPKTVPVKL